MSKLIAVGTISAPVYSYKPHSHEQWELIYYTSGYGNIVIDNIEYNFEGGNIFLVPPGIIHTDSAAKGFTNLYAYITSLEFPPTALKLEDTSSRDIYNLLLMVQREYYLHQESREPIISSLLNAILSYINVLLMNHPKNSNVELMHQLILKNFSDTNFTVGQLYDSLSINGDYARRLFLKEIGTTPTSLLRQCRIQKAKKLLETTNTNIYEIAMQCGFDDQYYFSKVFKQSTGVSPKNWKSCHSRQ